VGTMYDDKGDAGFLCATARCLGLDPAKLQDEQLKLWVDSGTGGSVTLKVEEKSGFVLDGLIPKILKLASLSANFNRTAVTVVSLEIPSATIRRLDREKTEDHINALPPTSKVRKAFLAKKLRVVVADAVAHGLIATVKVDRKLDAKLDATLAGLLDAKAGEPAPAGAGSTPRSSGGANTAASPSTQAPETPGLGLHVTSGDDGTYTLKALQPVIVAVLVKKQPQAGELQSEAATFDKWVPDIAIPLKE